MKAIIGSTVTKFKVGDQVFTGTSNNFGGYAEYVKLNESSLVLLKPVIDSIYPMDKIIEAHKYVDMGHKKGNVVVLIK